jgi:hypothetical protein
MGALLIGYSEEPIGRGYSLLARDDDLLRSGNTMDAFITSSRFQHEVVSMAVSETFV